MRSQTLININILITQREFDWRQPEVAYFDAMMLTRIKSDSDNVTPSQPVAQVVLSLSDVIWSLRYDPIWVRKINAASTKKVYNTSVLPPPPSTPSDGPQRKAPHHHCHHRFAAFPSSKTWLGISSKSRQVHLKISWSPASPVVGAVQYDFCDTYLRELRLYLTY